MYGYQSPQPMRPMGQMGTPRYRPGGTSDYIPQPPRQLAMPIPQSVEEQMPALVYRPQQQPRQGLLQRLMNNPRRQMRSERRQQRRERSKQMGGQAKTAAGKFISKVFEPFERYPGLSQGLIGGYKEVEQPPQRTYYSAPAALMPRYY